MTLTYFLIGKSRSGLSHDYAFLYPNEKGIVSDAAPLLRSVGIPIYQDHSKGLFFIRIQAGNLNYLLNDISARTGAKTERG